MKKREKEDEEGLLMRKTYTAGGSSSVLIGDHDSDSEEFPPTSSSHHHHHATSPDPTFSPWPHVFNLANCIIGVSVLAMPYVFQQCGILLAAIMIALCAVLTKLTCHFLAQAAFNTRTLSYESLAMATLGPSGRRFVELCLLVFLVSSIVAFIVVIGDIGPHLVAEFLELEAPTQRLRILVMIVVVVFIILPLSFIDDLKKFSVISSLACLFYLFFAVRMMLESLPTIYAGEWSIHVVWWRPQGFLTCLPIVCMAMCCQTQLFPVISCIKDATTDRVDYVVSNSINICAAMYAAVGVFGYVAFYSHELHGDVLVQFPPTIVTQSLKLAFLLSIAVSIPLMMFPARTALFCLILRDKDSIHHTVDLEKFTFHLLTAVILIFNTVLAILTPNVEFILGLTGAFIGSLVSTILPSTIYIANQSSETQNRARKVGGASTSTAKMCLIIGLFILIASTCAILMAEKKTSVVEKPKAKDDVASGELRNEELKSLESLEEKVLDKLDDISELAAKGNDTEAVKMLVEMKEQQKIQQELIEKQEKIVAQLNRKTESLANQTLEDPTAPISPAIPAVPEKSAEFKNYPPTSKPSVNTET
ncbi:Protein CBG22126 [Caenorhabditis briggsae]|uniref:Protein CBG22126 n=1 Tax=Caenorhabditis briggsae TaxID=6238 RepID=A8Y1K9_CAEBR|nr:Protein CBG22126 [Caenorhabditis briggsae]CAP38779.2 Protein CBG22126 [Caenorhabditis briggsae]